MDKNEDDLEYEMWWIQERDKKINRLKDKKNKSKERSLARRAKEERDYG